MCSRKNPEVVDSEGKPILNTTEAPKGTGSVPSEARPADTFEIPPILETMAELKRSRSGRRLGGLSLRRMIEKGRS